jgi:hypothetical protein
MARRPDPTAVPHLKAKLRQMDDACLLALTVDQLMIMRPGVDRREAEVILLACQATRRREIGA